MTLGERFTAWLRAEGDRRGGAADFSAALAESGYLPEARLLLAYGEKGPHVTELPPGQALWDGRRAHVGPHLPEAAPGELWLDTVEASLMVLLPGDPIEDFAAGARHCWSPCRSWLALRAVAGWQFAGLLAAGSIAPRDVDGFRLFDASRLCDGSEISPVLRATPHEINTYRQWFGKRIVDRGEWTDAVRLLGQEGVRGLWTPGAREWAGGVYQLDVYAAIEPDEIDVDDRDAFEAEEETPPAPGAQRFFGLYDIPPGGAAFRTAGDPRDGVDRALIRR